MAASRTPRALRLLAATLAGPPSCSPAPAAVRVGSLRLAGVAPPSPGTLLAHDGEVTEADGEVTPEKLPEALTVRRPLTGQSTSDLTG